MTLSLRTFSIMTLSINGLYMALTFSITTLSLLTFSIMTHSIKGLYMAVTFSMRHQA
jgi:hypothetical protein